MVSCHRGPYVLPGGSGRAFAIETIEATVELCLVFRSERKIISVDAGPEIVDQLELLVGRESIKVQGRLGHALQAWITEGPAPRPNSETLASHALANVAGFSSADRAEARVASAANRS